MPVSTDAVAQTRLKALPQSAQKKFEHLRRIELRQRALVDGLLDQQQHVRDQRDHAQRELAAFDRYHRHVLGEIKEDPKTGRRETVSRKPAERAALADRVEALTAEMRRISEQQAGANPGFATADMIDFLIREPATRTFSAVRAPFPSLGKAETFCQALVKNRSEQYAVRDEINFVENAGTTIAAAKARMREQVQAVSNRGRPDVSGLFRDDDVLWPTETFTAGGHGHHEYVVAATVKDAFALAVWANQEGIVAKLDKQIEAAGNDAIALDAAAKAQRLADLEARLLRLQRNEEAIIERLEGDGMSVHRSCTDPLVLLGIE